MSLVFIALVIPILAQLFCLFMLYRNWVVSCIKKEILSKDHKLYKNLPSYSTMLYQFTMWNTKSYTDRYGKEEETND